MDVSLSNVSRCAPLCPAATRCSGHVVGTGRGAPSSAISSSLCEMHDMGPIVRSEVSAAPERVVRSAEGWSDIGVTYHVGDGTARRNRNAVRIRAG